MKKWYDEEYEFEIEVIGFLRGDHTEHYCRNGEEVGDKYSCTYGCPVNRDGQGICSKTMMMLYPLMEAIRSCWRNRTSQLLKYSPHRRHRTKRIASPLTILVTILPVR